MKHLKITSILLTVSMCMSMIVTPVSVLADETPAPSETETVETTQKPEPKETEKKKPVETKVPKETEKPTETTKEEEAPEETSKPEPSETVKETEAAKPSESETQPAETSESKEPEETKPSESEPKETEETKPSESSETKETEESKPSESEQPEATEPTESSTEETVPEETVPSESDSKDSKSGYIASGECGKNMTWTLDENGTLTISGTGYIDFDNQDDIAPWYDYRTKIKTVVFDCSIEYLPCCSFADCTELTSIEFPKSLYWIEASAFKNCTSLKQLVIPKTVNEIGPYAFSGSGLTSIDFSAYGYIESGVFKDCKSLKSVTLSGDLNYVEEYAFYGCTSLSDVYLKGTESDWDTIIIRSDNDPLVNAKKHFSTPPTSGDVDTGLTWSYDGNGTLTISGNGDIPYFNQTNNTFKTPWRYYVNDIQMVVLDGKITSIGTGAFGNCIKLSSINLSDGIEEIGRCAFCNCPNLKSISIPGSVKTIEARAFDGCTGLTTVELHKGILRIEEKAFYNCSSLKEINIPYGVAKIDGYVFYGCKSLSKVTFPGSLVEIWGNSFNGCESLTSITIPLSVDSIYSYAFDGCTGITDVYYGGTNADWEAIYLGNNNEPLVNANKHFADSSNTGKCGDNLNWSWNGNGTLTITGSGDMYDLSTEDPYYGTTYYAPWYKFRQSITSVVISDDVTYIGNTAFYECEELVSITLPSKLTGIGDYAFGKCHKLSGISIPDGVTAIGSYAFYDCKSLSNVKLASGLKMIEEGTFTCCESLTSIVIPDSVISIGNSAFRSCSKLESVTFSNNLTKIGRGAFWYDSSLKEITMPSSLTTIDGYAFAECTNLKTVHLNDGLKSLGKRAFNECTSLESITIPGTITHLSLSAFKDCTGLKTVVIKDGLKRISCYTFDGCTSLSSVTIPDSVTEIGDSAFSGCILLAEINLPNSVRIIETYAFGRCTSLKSIVIPEGVKKIPESAFTNCSGLVSVTIPSSVTKIEEDAFYACIKLSDVYYGNTEDAWKKISIGGYNDPLSTATMHYTENPGHSISLDPVSGGSVTVSAASAKAGETITVTATPYKGYAVDSMKYNGKAITDGTFVMPDEDVKITVVFKKIEYNVTVNKPENGTASVSKTKAGIGDVIEVSYSPATGYELDKITVNTADITGYQFVMDAEDAAVSVSFKKILYKVTVNSGTADVEKAGIGDTVKLTANAPSADKKFDKWVVDSGKVTLASETSAETTFTMPAEPVTVTATYKDLYVATGTCGTGVSWTLDDAGLLNITGTGAMTDWTDKNDLPWAANVDTIKSVVIGEGVTTIGNQAFADCNNISQVTIPKSVAAIGNDIFSENASLTDIVYEGTKDDWDKVSISVSNGGLSLANIHLSDGSVIPGEKKENTLKVTGGKTYKVKYKKLRKKAQAVGRAKVITISNPQGKLTYRLLSVSKSKYKKYFKVNAANGVITVKKKLKKGTYTIKVTVTDSGNDRYKSVTRTTWFKIKVK